MLDWLKFNKNYPDFWKNYLEYIDKKSDRTVVFTIENTGNNGHKNQLISIGAIAIKNNKIIVGDSFEVNIANDIENIDDQNNEAFDKNIEKLDEQDALQNFVNYISNSTLIGHRVDLDIEILNITLKKMGCGELKNQALDLEVMFRKWKKISDEKNIEVKDLLFAFDIQKSERNNAIIDAYNLSIVFLKLKTRLGF